MLLLREAGQELRLGLSLGTLSTLIDLSFTEPYFMDRPMAAGFDLFRTSNDRQSVASYSDRSLGFALRAGWAYTEHTRQTVRYSLRQTNIYNVPFFASPIVQSQAGYSTTSEIAESISWDTRDQRINTTKGHLLRNTVAVGGPGGDNYYVRITTDAVYFQQLFEDVVRRDEQVTLLGIHRVLARLDALLALRLRDLQLRRQLDAEYGRSRSDERYRFVLTGIIHLPWQLTLAPIYEYGSGQPWNHRLGYDFNGDGKNSDRPSGVDRNDEDGPAFRQLSLRLTKSFALFGDQRLDVIAEDGDRSRQLGRRGTERSEPVQDETAHHGRSHVLHCARRGRRWQG